MNIFWSAIILDFKNFSPHFSYFYSSCSDKGPLSKSFHFQISLCHDVQPSFVVFRFVNSGNGNENETLSRFDFFFTNRAAWKAGKRCRRDRWRTCSGVPARWSAFLLSPEIVEGVDGEEIGELAGPTSWEGRGRSPKRRFRRCRQLESLKKKFQIFWLIKFEIFLKRECLCTDYQWL